MILEIIRVVTYVLFIIIKIEDFDINNILIDEKPDENILLYNISYKCLIDSKLLRIRFDQTDEFSRVSD